MNEAVELEIVLSRRDVDNYSVELRYSDMDDSATREPEYGLAHFDLADLRDKLLNPQAYGQALMGSLLEDDKVRDYFSNSLVASQTSGKVLRLRLFIDRSAPELHDLRWETMRNPQDESWLLTSQRILFSRFLSSTSWERIQLRSRGMLSALVVIANPGNLTEYQVDEKSLTPINAQAERQRAEDGLKDDDVQISYLVSDTSQPGNASLAKIIETLKQGFDVLYLVCHGALLSRAKPPGPYLYLENEEGKTVAVPGLELVERVRDLLPHQRPRLVVLASCQSAGEGDVPRLSDSQGALAAIGPQLAQAGVPAVLAMQGNITMETVAKFMPVFFRDLLQDGQIDRAIAVGRGAVRERPDSWMPVLFMRLRAGKLWFSPGFGLSRDEETEQLESLKLFIERDECTAIAGPGLTEALIGSRRDIAIGWVKKHGYPLSSADLGEMPRISQYLSTRKGQLFLRYSLCEAVQDVCIRRYGDKLPEELRKLKAWRPEHVKQGMDSVADLYWPDPERNPFNLLARLRLPVYISAIFSDNLADALRQAGADPQVRVCPWKDDIPEELYRYDDEPTPEKPLVYHLFGHLDWPLSLVLTEDEYFDFLLGSTANQSKIPSVVRTHLTSTALLFLGFNMDDWYFRVFFRMIFAIQGHKQLKFYSHAMAQVEPDEGQTRDVQRARKYLEKYFSSENISLYWGNSEEFLQALSKHLEGVR